MHITWNKDDKDKKEEGDKIHLHSSIQDPKQSRTIQDHSKQSTLLDFMT
jgi:hypothetical protein